jgi:hypothetical protein
VSAKNKSGTVHGSVYQRQGRKGDRFVCFSLSVILMRQGERTQPCKSLSSFPHQPKSRPVREDGAPLSTCGDDVLFPSAVPIRHSRLSACLPERGRSQSGGYAQAGVPTPSSSTVIARIVFDHAGGDNFGLLLDNVELNARVSSVPEPASLMLLGSGLAGPAVWRRNRQ